MTYNELKEKSGFNDDQMKVFFTVENAIIVKKYFERVQGRSTFYQQLRDSNETMENITDVDFDNIFNGGLSNEEIREALIKKGVTIIELTNNEEGNNLFKTE